MFSIRHLVVLTAVFSVGYAVGNFNLLHPSPLNAQDAGEGKVVRSEEAISQVRQVVSAGEAAAAVLENESLYKSAVRGANIFATSVGGTDGIADLEDGRGVDPETFAALYAERWSDEVEPNIGRDELGRLTYKGKLIRMYSQERLKKLFTTRESLAGASILAE